MAAEPSHDARLRRTLEQLRNLREHSAQRNAMDIERRRLEDQVREERHDAYAKTISAATHATDAQPPLQSSDTEMAAPRERQTRRHLKGRTRLKRN